jgi:hypothetical protein
MVRRGQNENDIDGGQKCRRLYLGRHVTLRDCATTRRANSPQTINYPHRQSTARLPLPFLWSSLGHEQRTHSGRHGRRLLPPV